MKLQTKQMNAADLWELLAKGVPYVTISARIPQHVDSVYVELAEFCTPAWGNGFCAAKMVPMLVVSDFNKERDHVSYNSVEGPTNYKICLPSTVHKT